jgi:hypothetical protein
MNVSEKMFEVARLFHVQLSDLPTEVPAIGARTRILKYGYPKENLKNERKTAYHCTKKIVERHIFCPSMNCTNKSNSGFLAT